LPLSVPSEQRGHQASALGQRLRLNLDLVQIRYWLSFGWRFDLTLLVGLQVDYKTLFCLLRALGQYLDPTWKVVWAFITNVVLETGPDAMLLIKDDLVRDLHDEEASFCGCHVHPADHAFAVAPHRAGRVEVNPNLIPHRNLPSS